MIDWFYNVPLLISGTLIIVALSLVGVAGTLVMRRFVSRMLEVQHEHSGFVGTMVASIMVFYGLAVALIAVSVWETHSGVSTIASNESTAIADLYQDVSSFPEPVRSELRSYIRDYTEYVIHEAWPVQRQGRLAPGGFPILMEFQSRLALFEPVTEGQKALYAEALQAYNQLIERRCLRLEAAETHLSGVLWLVIVMGAFISLFSTAFFRVEDVRLHAIMVSLLASFIGLIIVMVLAYDRPFCGQLGVGPDAYELVYDQLMNEKK